ncbi:DUF3095 family protein [Dyadobacter sp. CY356]|uniref:DUF3095 family protein n=1 Tax=Dyadobacter sp. CY356 TaxID=2906442 RepID=UPI001F28CC0A|nr:DUF3095 family protein [Dyadobacter sp. CY356]MCF0058648.1 DUF3095 domain-containing protein [Dyadobacter sp. CY356]
MQTLSINDLFYSALPVNKISLSDLLIEDQLFYKLPDDWHVVVTDVKNSTLAVQNGLHEAVNLIATGCIVAVLNIARKHNLSVPFFFGGDGATCIIPPLILHEVMRSLQIHKDNTSQNFNIDLRVGRIPVCQVYQNGFALRISKFKSSSIFSIPVVLGDGLSYAEKLIKGEDFKRELLESESQLLDLEGMQCRWDRIAPPENLDEVISLLVIAKDEAQQGVIFKEVVDLIDNVYGTPQNRQPISVSKLKLKSTLAKIKLEMKVKFGRLRFLYMVYNRFILLFGPYYFNTKEGKSFLSSIVELADTLVIDGRINTVISGNTKQRLILEDALNNMEIEGKIKYGLFVSKESIMSCYVPNEENAHIHFVDGAEGGYTRAAGILKQKNRLS